MNQDSSKLVIFSFDFMGTFPCAVSKLIPENPFVAIEGEKAVLNCILKASEYPPPPEYGTILSIMGAKHIIPKTGGRIKIEERTIGKYICILNMSLSSIPYIQFPLFHAGF